MNQEWMVLKVSGFRGSGVGGGSNLCIFGNYGQNLTHFNQWRQEERGNVKMQLKKINWFYFPPYYLSCIRDKGKT